MTGRLPREVQLTLGSTQPTRFRLNRQAPIDPDQYPSDGLLDGLADLRLHPTTELLG